MFFLVTIIINALLSHIRISFVKVTQKKICRTFLTIFCRLDVANLNCRRNLFRLTII